MSYDTPYRLEIDAPASSEETKNRYVIVRTGEGVICRGYNFTEMRTLVDSANDMVAIAQGDRGR